MEVQPSAGVPGGGGGDTGPQSGVDGEGRRQGPEKKPSVIRGAVLPGVCMVVFQAKLFHFQILVHVFVYAFSHFLSPECGLASSVHFKGSSKFSYFAPTQTSFINVAVF